MDPSINPEQVESVLSHLARLRHHGSPAGTKALESLRPAWLGITAWDMLLEDLDAQRYRERKHAVRLRLVK